MERASDAPFSPEELARFKARVAPLAVVDLEACRPRFESQNLLSEPPIAPFFYREHARRGA
jgi:hypothetical protein